jgi:hypothetical protein
MPLAFSDQGFDYPFPTDYMAEITVKGRVKQHFHYWLGASGKPYLHTVFNIENIPQYTDAVILAVRQDSLNRTPLLLARTGKIPNILFSGAAFAGALARGANELHVHLMGKDERELKNTEADLAYLFKAPARTCLNLAA